MLGIIGGTSLLFSSLPALEKKRIATPYGPAEILCGDVAMLMRHQGGVPPHRINHRANLAALAICGVDSIVSFGSTGSLKPEIVPGSLLIPSDYVSMSDIPTIHNHAIGHVMPELSQVMASELSRIVPSAGCGGIYVQTRGPRIETIAEIRALAGIADIVGMTVASEATLATEMNMDFCSLCTVDNYANGIGCADLSYDEILKNARANRDRTEEIVSSIIRGMA